MMHYNYRWMILYLTQIFSSIFLMIQNNNIPLIFIAIALLSINSYLGESSMLSLSSHYEEKEMKFWSIGTGLAGLCATGFYLVMNQWLDVRIIFGINLILYLLIYSLSLYLLDYRMKITNNQNEHKEIDENQPVPLEEFHDDRRLSSISEGQETLQTETKRINHLDFLFDIYPLVIAYFISYLLGFAYVPLLVQNDFEYQLTQFITGTAMFIGRTSGNYISIQKIRLFGVVHLYNFISIILFTISIITKIGIPYFIVNLMLVLTYIINGISYPAIYNHIYKNYHQSTEWYMGAVGQYTSFAMIIGCMSGYPLQMLLKN